MRFLKPALIAINILLLVDIVRCVERDSLHRECVLGNTERVAGLVAGGRDVNEAIGGKTPLYLAAEHGHLEIVRILVEAGADPNAGDFSGRTPLDSATENGHQEVARYLAEHGAGPGTQ